MVLTTMKYDAFVKCVTLLSVSMSVERRKVLLVRVSVVLLEHLLLPLSCGVVHYGIESARAFVERVESVLDLLKRY